MSLIIFLVVLSVLVVIHELGHYTAARIFGVKAEEFGVGFPPRAIGFVRNGNSWKRVNGSDQSSYKNTIWSLNWLPLGGFVRLKGESGENAYDKDAFQAKPVYARFIILAAGVVMNWMLAVAIFSIGFLVGVPAQLEGMPESAIVSNRQIQITQVIESGAAAKGGLLPGDAIQQFNGTQITNVKQAQDLLASNGTQPMTVVVQRDQETKTVQVTPEFVESINRPGLGIAMSETGTIRFPWYQVIPQGVSITFAYTKAILGAFGGLIRDLFIGRGVSPDVSGPVGIAVMTGKIANQGWWSLMQFAAMLSINLSIVNFLPIPALDGGRALFVIIEGMRRRRMNPNFEANLHRAGFALLMILIIIVTARDLYQYGPIILGGIKHLVGM